MADVLASLSVRLGADTADFENGLARASKRVATFTSQVNKDLSQSFSGFDKITKEWSKGIGRLGEGIASVGQGLSIGVTVPILAAGAAAVKMAADFEQMSNVLQAQTGATAKEMEAVSAKAKELGADLTLPGTSATDSLTAISELAKGGLSLAAAMDAAKGSIQLSTAAQVSNARAAEIQADALNAFSLPATEASRVADLLAGAANAASGSIDLMAQGFAAGSAVAKMAGLSISEYTASLTLMARAGIKGSDAGTSIKSMLMALQSPSSKAAEKLQEIGISIFDTQGKMKPFGDIITEFSGKLKGLTDQKKADILGTVFGSDGIRAASIIFGAGPKGFADIEAGISKAGSAAALAAAQNKGFYGTLDAIKSQAETFLQGAAAPFLEGFSAIGKGVAGIIGKLDALPGPAKTMIVAFAAIAAATGPLLIALGGIMTLVPAITAGVAAIGSAFALMTGPIGLIVAAVAGTAILIIRNWDTIVAYFKSGPGKGIFSGLAAVVQSSLNAVKAIVAKITTQILAFWKRWGGLITTIVGTAFNGIIAVVSTVLNNIAKVIDIFTSVLTGNWSAAWESLRGIFENNVNLLITLVANLVTGTIDLFKGFLEGLGVGEGFQQVLAEASKGVSGFAQSIKLGNKQAAESTKKVSKEIEKIKNSASAPILIPPVEVPVVARLDAGLTDEQKKALEEFQKASKALQGQRIVSDANTNAAKERVAAIEKEITAVKANENALKKLNSQLERQKSIQAKSVESDTKIVNATARIEQIQKEIAALDVNRDAVKALNAELVKQQQIYNSSQDDSQRSDAAARVREISEQLKKLTANEGAIKSLNVQLAKQKNILSQATIDSAAAKNADERIVGIQKEISALSSNSGAIKVLNAELLKQQQILEKMPQMESKASAVKENISRLQSQISLLNQNEQAVKTLNSELEKQKTILATTADASTASATRESIAGIEKQISLISSNEAALKKLNVELERQKLIQAQGADADTKIINATARISQIQKEIAALDVKRESEKALNAELVKQQELYNASQNNSQRGAAAARIKEISEALKKLTANEGAIKSLNIDLEKQNTILSQATTQSDRAKNAATQVDSIQKEIAALSSNTDAVKLLNVELQRQQEILKAIPQNDINVGSVRESIAGLQAQIAVLNKNEEAVKSLNEKLLTQKEILATATDATVINAARERIANIEAEITALSSSKVAVGKLTEELVKQKAILEGNSFDYTSERIQLLQKSLEDLVSKGFGPGTAVIQQIQAELNKLNGELAVSKSILGSAVTVETNVERTLNTPKNGISIPQVNDIAVSSLVPEVDLQKLRELQQVSVEVSDTVQGAIGNMAVTVGESLANMFTGVDSGVGGLKSLFLNIMGVVGDFLSQFGKALIGAAVAAIAFEKLLVNPFAALAAGVALIAAGAIVKNVVSKGLSGGGGGGASTTANVTQPVQRIGDQGTLKVEGTIRGNDLALSNKKTEQRQRRTNGR